VRTSCYVFGGRALIELLSLAARGRRISTGGALLLSASACAVMGPSAPPVHVVSVPLPASIGSLDESEYQSAARAIKQRDYGLALDLLQDARIREPNDVRVVNAFGVVYDKLGRFDLSARYYADAAKIDPSSAIVRNNLAYSRKLQGLAADATPPTDFAALPTPTPPATDERAPAIPSTVGRALASEPRLLTAPPALTAAAALPVVRAARVQTIEAASITVDAANVRLEPTAAAAILEAPAPQTVANTQIALSVARPAPEVEASAPRPVAPMASAQLVQLASVAADVASAGPGQATAAISASLQTVADAPMAVAAVAQPEAAAPPVRSVEEPQSDRAATGLRNAWPVVATAEYSSVGSPRVAVVRTPLQQADHPSIVYLTAATRMADTQPLVVINASGRRFGVGPIRVALIRRGWSPPLVFASRRYHLAHTTIRYARADGAIARSLARTLPGRTRLVACSRECHGIRLIVGVDAVNWRFVPWMRHYG
jgi:hypothetical protein